MDQTQFYVYHAGEQVGPYSLEEITSKIQSKELDMSDYIYDEGTKDWTILVGFEPLQASMSSVKATEPTPKKSEEATKPADEWYALKGDLRFGPFAYTEIVRLLQDKSMQEADYVWHSGMDDWKKILDIPEFSADAIKKLRESGIPLVNEVFFRRRHARVDHESSILMHNNQKVFRGKGIEISAGGAGLLLEQRESKYLDVGHQLFLHFKPDVGLPPFNAVCEVVSRRPVNSADPTAATHFGVKFLKVDAKATAAIETFAAQKRLNAA